MVRLPSGHRRRMSRTIRERSCGSDRCWSRQLLATPPREHGTGEEGPERADSSDDLLLDIGREEIALGEGHEGNTADECSEHGQRDHHAGTRPAARAP